MPSESRAAIEALFRAAGINFERDCLQQSATDCDIWIRLNEAAKIANVTVYTIRRWCASGLIEWRKLNKARCGRVLVNRSSLMKFINDCEIKRA